MTFLQGPEAADCGDAARDRGSAGGRARLISDRLLTQCFFLSAKIIYAEWRVGGHRLEDRRNIEETRERGRDWAGAGRSGGLEDRISKTEEMNNEGENIELCGT